MSYKTSDTLWRMSLWTSLSALFVDKPALKTVYESMVSTTILRYSKPSTRRQS